MDNIILKIENLSKQYRLGLVGTGTLQDDLKRWWYNLRGKENPFLKVGDVNDRSSKGKSDYVWALQGINFEVQKGEVLGIIGKNGAGKSTLLKILSKITSPTTGSIKSRGRIASLLEVGTGFHGEMTGRENIYLNGAILGMTKAEITAKLDEIIEFSGCERYINTPVKRYSSGMTVRLAFAVAAFLEPDILVIDEVLAVGDVEFQKKAIGKMQDISRGEGRTVLFVSHNMAAVKSLCTRAIVLENGENVFEGDQNEAVNYYLIANKPAIEKQDLRHKKDRTGNGDILISKVEVLNKNNDIVEAVISGGFLRLKVYFEIRKEVNFKELFIGIAIKDRNDANLVSFLSDEMNSDFSSIETNGFLVLSIPNLYLRAGLYNLTIQVGDGSTKIEDFIDFIENAAQINVLPGDIWNIGKPNRSGNFGIFPANYI